MTHKTFSLRLATGILTFTLVGLSQAQEGLPPVQQANGTEYVTGGFGDNAAQAFKQAESAYPLTLVFAEDAGQGSRPYVADVSVVVKDDTGKVVMQVPSAGPYLLARLAPGKYQIEATYMGQTQTQEVQLAEAQPSRQVFTWKTN